MSVSLSRKQTSFILQIEHEPLAVDDLSILRDRRVNAGAAFGIGRSSLSANQTTSFSLVSGFGSGAYSPKLLAGIRQTVFRL
jgi:hypothetical protein